MRAHTEVRRRFSRAKLSVTALFLVVGSSAQARDIAITRPHDFASSLDKARPGDELILVPGDYGALYLKSGVSLRSSDPKAPARFSGVTGQDATNVVLRD